MEMRFKETCKLVGKLMAAGEVVFSPIVHMHPIAVVWELPRNWEFWEKIDREFISVSSKVFIAMMDGWNESVGVQAEIKIAVEMNKPISYIEP
jgi:hypothetical protein